MGTTVQSMPAQRALSNPRTAGGQDGMSRDGVFYQGANGGTYTPQPGQHHVLLSPGGRPVGPAGFGGQFAPGQGMPSVEAAREQQALVHQQEQRGVSQLQNAVSAAASGGLPRQALMSPQGSGTPLPGQQMEAIGPDGQPMGAGMEKRPPVEFNHAISYVNKIKVGLSVVILLFISLTPHFTEPLLFTTRYLQAVPRDPPDIPARIKANPRRLRPSHPSLPHRARPSRRFQAVSARVRRSRQGRCCCKTAG